MGSIEIILQPKTVNHLDQFQKQFTEKRNLGEILRIIAIKAIAAGDSLAKIADELRTAEQTVRNWVNDFLMFSIRSLNKLKAPGRPKKLSKYEEYRLKEMIKNPPEKVCRRHTKIEGINMT